MVKSNCRYIRKLKPVLYKKFGKAKTGRMTSVTEICIRSYFGGELRHWGLVVTDAIFG